MLSTNTAAFLCANGHIYTEANEFTVLFDSLENMSLKKILD